VHRRKNSDESHQEQKRIPPYEIETISDLPSDTMIQSEPEVAEKISAAQCLFCNIISTGLDSNIDHMSSSHGLFIPSLDHLSDAESFLGYLATTIFSYKECLFCGVERGTVDGVQTHMRDKGHCMIKMNADSELLDFWDFTSSDEDTESQDRKKPAAVKLSDTEMRLPSGMVINSRSDAAQLRANPSFTQKRAKSQQSRTIRDEAKAIEASENPDAADQKQPASAKGSDHRVAVRGEMGLVGVSESQKRALVITEKKMKRREAVAKAAYRHAMERQPKKTIYYKVRSSCCCWLGAWMLIFA
jgi:pre-60S factor REI1